jgi:choice-of-anchor C domain-containing protein
MNHLGRMLLVVSVLAAAAVAAHAEAPWGIVVNGSFEESTFGPGGTWNFQTLSQGSTAITGWTVMPNGLDYINRYWYAQDGDRSLDLNATSAGGIKQVLNTVVGHDYKVEFWLAGNPELGLYDKPVQISALVGGGTWDFTYQFPSGYTNPAGTAHPWNLAWEKRSLVFTAAGPTTTLQFLSLVTDKAIACGPVLDNVSVVDQTPELPSGALLLLGMVPAGLAWWRRRK